MKKIVLVVTVVATMAAASPVLAIGDRDNVGLADPVTGLWHLRDADGDVLSFYFGNPGDVPFMGDWDCDGVDTPGLYRQSDGFVYLRNSNTTGIAEIEFFFGNPGDRPIAGDFNGNGCDTVSIYRPAAGRFFIINVLGSAATGLGAAEFDYFFGNPGDKPFVGDFDGNGVDTVGLHRESTGRVYFRNSHTAGTADADFVFGDPGDRFVAGDWTKDGRDTPVLFRPTDKQLYFRFANAAGLADQVSQPGGESEWTPVAGYFGNLAAGPQQPENTKVQTGAGSGELSLLWDAVAGAASYRVYWSLRPGDPKALLATVGEATDQFGNAWVGAQRFLHDGIDAPRSPRNTGGGLECYRVTALDASGREGPSSKEACLPASPFFAPAAHTSGGSGEISFTWKAPAGADHYDVYWGVLPGGSKTKLASVSEASDQFGLPWAGATRRYIDGLPPNPPRTLTKGLNCYYAIIYFTPGGTNPGPATAEACFQP